VERAGLTALACEERAVVDAVPSPPPPPAEETDRRLAWAISLSWPAQARTWVASLLEQTADWVPDLVVVEPAEFAGRVVAAVLDVPVVEHGWGFTLPAGLTALGVNSLADLYAALGTRPVPVARSVDLGTPGLQPADAAPVPRYRYRPWAQPGEPLPPLDGRPRVLVTLGTFDNPDAAQRIRIAVDAAHACDTQVIAVLGNADRRSGTSFAPGTVVRDWIDIAAAVSTCALVVHHGGAGTSWATLAAGRPAVVLPQMGDQFRNSAQLATRGVAVPVGPTDLDARTLRMSIEHALVSTSIAHRAQQVASENMTLPDSDRLATDLASLG
jgi:L-noviosyl transferase